MKEIKINTDIIKLDSFLKWCGAVSLGSEAKILIQNGSVKLNNNIETRRSKKLSIGDIVELNGIQYKLI
ncbi:RNA-binding S4 domain-containing protein [Clostridium tyrobutyricum]|uniref:RNA-binding S4 domain-containing protein n=1 Tax=Clostridium tyrobutyricum TaxID=1519 RepID=UPI001C38F7DF|nr:RNA-binding S4 domain-containing protein [Clostridium tyrobutyricum]MBV4420039.1 RNA-binding S4 domain-containing protein [Clostridium tyrobutyricum]